MLDETLEDYSFMCLIDMRQRTLKCALGPIPETPLFITRPAAARGFRLPLCPCAIVSSIAVTKAIGVLNNRG